VYILEGNKHIAVNCELFFTNLQKITLTIPTRCIKTIAITGYTEDGEEKKYSAQLAQNYTTNYCDIYLDKARDFYISQIEFELAETVTAAEWGRVSTYSPKLSLTLKVKEQQYYHYEMEGVNFFYYPKATERSKCINSYPYPLYPTKGQWCWGSNLEEYKTEENRGELPAPFSIVFENSSKEEVYCEVWLSNKYNDTEKNEVYAQISTLMPPESILTWDSRTAIVYATDYDGKNKRVLNAQGDLNALIPAGNKAYPGVSVAETHAGKIEDILTSLQLKYHYWYY
jgi:hypothetical protein